MKYKDYMLQFLELTSTAVLLVTMILRLEMTQNYVNFQWIKHKNHPGYS